MEKYGFVYIWRDKGKNRYYIGAHWGSEDDGYICSSTWMRNSYNRRKCDFRRHILFKCNDIKEIFDKEYEWLKLIPKEELGKKYYNNVIFNYNNGRGRIVSDYTKEKQSKSASGRKASEETKEKLRNRVYSEETKKKMSEAKKGKTSVRKGSTLTKEQKKKISNTNKLKGIKPDYTGKGTHWYNNGIISLPRYECPEGFVLGRLPPSDEVKNKMSEAKKGKISPRKGVTLSKETKQKISASKMRPNSLK